MADHLKKLFDRVLDDEPALPDGALARQAMAQGRGIRRRRGLLAGGSTVAALVVAAVALNLAPAPPGPPPQVTSAAARLAQAEPQCTWPASNGATDVSIVLRTDITAGQTDDLRNALHADPLVRDLQFESREVALTKFKRMWDDRPELVADIDASEMYPSFRLKLTRPAQYRAFAATYADRAGVDQLVGGTCP